MRLRRFAATTILLLACTSVFAQDRGPSTPEERAKALKLIRGLEADPLASDARDARQWLTIWLASVPDITVPVCAEFLEPMLGSKKNYAPEIFLQSMYSSAAVVIENPSANEDNARNISPVSKAHCACTSPFERASRKSAGRSSTS